MGLPSAVNIPEELTPEEQAQKEAQEKAVLQSEFQKFLQNAERGDSEAQRELENIYLIGTHGVSEDGEKALYCFKKAADQNDTFAIEALGKIYSNGMAGVKKMTKKLADFWFDKRQKIIQLKQKDAFKNNHISAANAFMTGDKVNIRVKPTISSKVLAQLNTKYSVLATKQTKDRQWYLIETAIGPNMLSQINGIIPKTVVTGDIATGLILLTPVSTIER